MHVFFGRINVNQTPTDQLQNAYYHAKKGTTYFAELNQFENFTEESVYVFMIGGSKVELWKANHWGADGQNLFFTKTGVDLDEMTRPWLAAFKFFYLDADLIVFTTRRPFKKAFFKLKVDENFTEDMLLNPITYSDQANYRKIELQAQRSDGNSRNIIFNREDNHLQFKSPDFFDDNLAGQFIDNTSNIGNGRPNKDTILRKVSQATLPSEFDANQLTLLNVYDVFFCDYNGTIEEQIFLNQEERFFKISMSPKDIDDESFNYFTEKNLVVVHKDTASKGTSYESQGHVFINKIKVGDYIYLCRGNQKFIMIGKVTSDAKICELDEFGDEGWMQREVEVLRPCTTDDKYEGASKWWTPNNNSTCIQIPESELSVANTLIFAPYFSVAVRKTFTPTIIGNAAKKETKIPMSLNSIFFGPPGTGKTYQLLELIKEWKLIEENTQDLQYESFLQDLPWWQVVALVLLELKTANVSQILDHELVKAKFSISSIQNKRARVWSTLQHHTVEECENVKFKNRQGVQLFYKEINSVWRLHDAEQAKSELEEVILQLEDIKAQEKTTAKRNYSFITCHQSLSYEDFIEGIKPVAKKSEALEEEERELSYEIKKGVFYMACEKAAQLTGYGSLEECLLDDKIGRKNKFADALNNNKRYVVFLDEINRCNVSSVFGELITLIEDDKRLGAKNEMTDIILPYSQTHFGVPANLFIVGTMNTADRSVEALDTALRRRFAFVPKLPEENKLGSTTDGIDLSKMLATINTRLKILKDNDHTIGHAWLWDVRDVEQLKIVFGNKILPLLQEYFYNDYEKLGLVLGNAFFKTQKPVSCKIFSPFKGSNGLAAQYDQSWQFELQEAKDLRVADFQSLENLITQAATDEDDE